MGQDLLNAIEESRSLGFVNGALNATFVTLIPKTSKPKSFYEFRPIAVCNFAYKVISKIIALRIKDKLALCISRDHFGFLNNMLIFYDVGLTQEGLHSSKVKKQKSIFLKLDLKKAYNKVNQNFLKMILIQIGLKWEVV